MSWAGCAANITSPYFRHCRIELSHCRHSRNTGMTKWPSTVIASNNSGQNVIRQLARLLLAQRSDDVAQPFDAVVNHHGVAGSPDKECVEILDFDIVEFNPAVSWPACRLNRSRSASIVSQQFIRPQFEDAHECVA